MEVVKKFIEKIENHYLKWFRRSGGIKLKIPQEECCQFPPVSVPRTAHPTLKRKGLFKRSANWRSEIILSPMSESYNSHPSFSRVSEGLTCPIFWNSKQASALSCAMSSTLRLHGEASPEFITTELRKLEKFSWVLARQSDNLNTTRAANDPSVFAITEKVPTRVAGPPKSQSHYLEMHTSSKCSFWCIETFLLKEFFILRPPTMGPSMGPICTLLPLTVPYYIF